MDWTELQNPSSWDLPGNEGFSFHGYYARETEQNIKGGQTTIWVICPYCEAISPSGEIYGKEHQLVLFPEGNGYLGEKGWFQHDLCAEAIEELIKLSAKFSILRGIPSGEYYDEPLKKNLGEAFLALAQKAKEKGSLQT